jgi:hypothetical protein
LAERQVADIRISRLVWAEAWRHVHEVITRRGGMVAKLFPKIRSLSLSRRALT